MFRRNIYYTLKPLIPLRARRAVRGYFARRKVGRVSHIWPILQSAGTRPEGWPGWPDGRPFAFVLTHDVEGADGLSRVRQLAELEMSLGFRSSFNFVPEGEYSVPPALRTWLTENGFEVGVHDLHHDGKLYTSREEFRRRAQRINHYLKEWGAVGYRSGFMLHNYAWHHDLDMGYDATAFDTDPFEPQPDGVGTIFPFFVERPENGGPKDQRTKGLKDQEPAGQQELREAPVPSSLRPFVRGPLDLPAPRRGYVELPYTLPQDSTVFFVLGQTTDEVWRSKLEWIAEKGGMALLNTHPDYMYFGSGSSDAQHFSSEIYANFLRHVSERFRGQYWNAVPAGVARHVRDLAPARTPRQPRRVCMITYSHYDNDNRVRRYAECLAARGDEVDVLAVCPGPEHPREVRVDGVHVTRLVSKQRLTGSVAAYCWQVTRFCLAAAAVITRRTLRQRYDLVHVHNMPDFVVFAALVPRLLGARVILDLHDLVPELFSDKLHGWRSRLAGWFLRMEERLSAAFAHHVIISNHLWVDDVVARSVRREKCSVFINNVDDRIFYRRHRTRTDERKIILFHGSLSRHQGVDLVIEAMPAVLARIPTAQFHIYGGTAAERAILEPLAERLGLLGDAVQFFPAVELHRIPEIVANADLGVVAKRADSFGNRAYSTKILEFMSQGVPVVLSRTEIDQFYFDRSVATFFDSGNVAGLADAIKTVLTDPDSRVRQVRYADALVAANSWRNRQAKYLDIVDSLISRTPLPGGLTNRPPSGAPTPLGVAAEAR